MVLFLGLYYSLGEVALLQGFRPPRRHLAGRDRPHDTLHVRVELHICFFRYYRDELRVAMKAAAEVGVRFASSRDDIMGCVAGMICELRYGELTRCYAVEISKRCNRAAEAVHQHNLEASTVD